MRSVTFLIISLCWLSHSVWSLAQEVGNERYSFNRDIRPILADKCFACHGFDSKQRQANLRLDQADGAYGTADSGHRAIVPGQLDASELWLRIQSTDLDTQMPPQASHKSLTAVEKEILRAWIEQGAEFQGHWAFEPIIRPELEVGAGTNIDVTAASIDDWIERPLKVLGTTLAKEADRGTLLRRLSLDLTGLPATPQEVDVFINDGSPDAWDKQVARLMRSPGPSCWQFERLTKLRTIRSECT